jgi:hypothetical protein
MKPSFLPYIFQPIKRMTGTFISRKTRKTIWREIILACKDQGGYQEQSRDKEKIIKCPFGVFGFLGQVLVSSCGDRSHRAGNIYARVPQRYAFTA